MSSTLNLSCRQANSNDVDAILALVHSAYRGDASRIGWTTEADLLDGTRTDADEVGELICKPNSCILLCEQQQTLQASVHLENRGDHAYLGMFAVSPQAQRQGIGKLLLASAENLVSEQWHCGLLQMTVITLREELIAWYQRRGYERTGELRSFPYGQPRYGDPRRDDLVLEVLQKILS